MITKMSNRDYTVNAVGQISQSGPILATGISGSPISKKPSYLIRLVPSKGTKPELFVTIDKLDFENNGVKIKRIFFKIFRGRN